MANVDVKVISNGGNATVEYSNSDTQALVTLANGQQVQVTTESPQQVQVTVQPSN